VLLDGPRKVGVAIWKKVGLNLRVIWEIKLINVFVFLESLHIFWGTKKGNRVTYCGMDSSIYIIYDIGFIYMF
jgi:hypothetical protein